MKKIFIFAAAMAAAMMAQATVVVDETFTDFPGTAWTESGSVTTGVGRSLAAALSYTEGGKTFVLSGQGNAVQTALDASDKYQHTKSLPEAVTTDCYISFLLRADGQQKQTQAQVFGLGSPSLAMRVWIGKGTVDVTKCRLGVTRSSGTGADVQWGATEFDVDETMLIVLKYTMTATDTVASLFVNPAIGGTEPATPLASDNTKGANKCKASLTNMTFYTTGNTKSYFTVGAARVSTTWAEAVAEGGSAPQEDPDYANSLLANFGDSTIWTNRVDVAPVSGSFPTDTLNEYILTSTAVVKAGRTLYLNADSTEFVKFYARAHVDKSTYKASIETPWLASLDTLYFYGNAGSDDKVLKIETRVANGKWTELTTVNLVKDVNVYAIPVGLSAIKLRLSNTTTSSMYFFYIGDLHPRAFAEHKEPTGLQRAERNVQSAKLIENGQVVILKNGKKYNVLGAEL